MSMRRLLGSVLFALALLLAAGCGEEEPGTVSDEPAPTPSSLAPESPEPGDEQVDFELVEAITETAAGGTVNETAVSLNDDQAVAEFVSQFTNDTMSSRIQDLVRETKVPDGVLIYGAVVAIGCDPAPDVRVLNGDSGLTITAEEIMSPTSECFAAMTTVAVVLVPSDGVS
jgi:hypothetical protein